jgi:hypothetical protein
MKKQHILIFVIAIIVVGALSFYVGSKLGVGARSMNGKNGIPFGNGAPTSMTGRAKNDNMVTGQILSMDSNSITVQIPNNGSKIILLTDSTPISKMASGTRADLVVGETVTATGTTNPDGSVTAQSIQIRPAMPENAAPNPTK